MSLLLALAADAGHDQLWLLLAAQRMGGSLNPYGPGVFESNPPLAIWLSALVVQAARVLHLPLTWTLKAAVLAVAIASACGCRMLLRGTLQAMTPARRWLLAIASVLIFGAVPARDFGQRDHILTLLILPYLAVAARELAHRWRPDGGPRRPSLPSSLPLRLLVTLPAAAGFALKPHHALTALGVELAVLLLARPHRPRLLEPLTLLAAAGAYYAAIRLLAPTYLTQILPVLRSTYWAFGHLQLYRLQLASIPLHLLLLAAIVVEALRIKRALPARTLPLTLILIAAGIGADCAYVAQGTGWYYQQLPAIGLFALALTLQLLDLPFAGTPPRWLPAALAGLTLLALGLTTYFSDFRPTPRGLEQAQPTPDPAFFTSLPPGTAVATLTTSVDDTVPDAFRYRLTLAQRYPHLWMLPAILRNQSGPTPARVIPAARLAELDRMQHRFMVEDLQRWQPQIVLVERCQDPAVHCQVLEDRHDNLLAWFLRDPAFAAIFARYRLVRSSGPYDEYAVIP
jgi:hypothetical protein